MTLLDLGGNDVEIEGTITAVFAGGETGSFVADDSAALQGRTQHVRVGDCRALPPSVGTDDGHTLGHKPIYADEAIVIFVADRGRASEVYDWRATGQALPAGAIVRAIAWGDFTVLLHGFGPDQPEAIAVLACRDRALREMLAWAGPDPLQGYSPDEIIVGPGGQTLTEAAGEGAP